MNGPGIAWRAWVIALLVSGCLGTSGSKEPDRDATLGKVVWSETAEGQRSGWADVKSTFSWQAREAAVEYLGERQVLDEWAREVMVHAFRFDAMRFIPEDEGGKNEFVPVAHEYYFDATDGRFMGWQHVERDFRSFVPASDRDPVVGDGTEDAAFLFMASHVAATVPEPRRSGLRMEEVDDRPLPGDCQPYRLRSSGIDTERTRMVVCLREGNAMPMWAFVGNSSTWVSVELLTNGLTPPAIAGDPLPPVQYARRPWQTIEDVFSDSGFQVPPSEEGDWAAPVIDRAKALSASPGVSEFVSKSDEARLAFVFLSFDDRPPRIPVDGQRTSFFLSSDAGFYWNDVLTTEVLGQELHRADLGGLGAQLPFPDRRNLELVLLNGPAKALAGLAPREPGWIVFDTEFTEGAEESRVSWMFTEPCDYPGSTFLRISAVNGQLLEAGRRLKLDLVCFAGG